MHADPESFASILISRDSITCQHVPGEDNLEIAETSTIFCLIHLAAGSLDPVRRRSPDERTYCGILRVPAQNLSHIADNAFEVNEA
jgi:hypothetical protein